MQTRLSVKSKSGRPQSRARLEALQAGAGSGLPQFSLPELYADRLHVRPLSEAAGMASAVGLAQLG